MLKLLCFLIPLSTANVTSASDLVSAAKNKSIVEVEACLAKGAQIDSVDEIGETEIKIAIGITREILKGLYQQEDLLRQLTDRKKK